MSDDRGPWRAQPVESTGLAQYAQTLRAHIRWVVLSMILVLGAATVYLKVAANVYEAHAQVLVQPVPSDSTTQLGLGVLRETGDPTRPLETLSRIITTNTLAERVITDLKLSESPRALLLRINASPVAQSNIVDIAARASTAEAAQRLANGFGQAIVDDRTARLHKELDALIPRFRDQVNSLSASALAQPGSPLQQLRELQTLRAGLDPTVRFETPAPKPTSPVSPRPLLTMVAAILGGLVLGVGGAFMLQLIDPRLRRESQLRDSYRLPVLARIPAPGRMARRRGATETSRDSVNIYRALRIGLGQRPDRTGARLVVVTGPPHPPGTPSAAAGLAWSLSRGGDRVLFVAADTTHGSVADTFRVRAPAVGLAEVLAGTAEMKTAVARASESDRTLLVMAAGDMAGVSDDAFGHGAAERFVEDVAGPFDWVIVDAPPLDHQPDLMSIAEQADDVVVAVRQGVSRLRDIDELCDALDQYAVRPRGFVLSGV